jgi:hypothetical protein
LEVKSSSIELQFYPKENKMSIKRNLGKITLVIVAIAAVAFTVSFASPASADGYEHGIVITVDGKDYYFDGAPDGPNGATDIPGHFWKQTSPTRLLGEHYNTGPFDAASWWSSDADDGSLIYTVEAIIDTWSQAKAGKYAASGYQHYHELVSVEDGSLHPQKVVWLRHTPAYTVDSALANFTLDGGPHPELAYEVDLANPLIVFNSVDRQFIPNYFIPYNP